MTPPTHQEVEQPGTTSAHACDRDSNAERTDLTRIQESQSKKADREEQAEKKDESSSDSHSSHVVRLT